MKYQNITTDDMKNGDGLRVVLWVSGCEHHCPGCQNPVTWDPDDGLDFDDNALQELLRELEEDYISGLTLSGGDPLHPANRKDILALCQVVKTIFLEKTIWLYTGYTFLEGAKQGDDILQIYELVDVIVDGPFIQEKADINYHWAGSTNQIVWRKKDGMWYPDED